MPAYTLREFDCTNCGENFTMMERDMILPIPRLCDTCLPLLWDADRESLDQAIALHLDRLKEKWASATALIESRIQDRINHN